MTSYEPPKILGLLSDPVRWRLLTELGRSDRRVSELVEILAKPQNLISYHLAEFRNEGIVTARRSSADGRDMYYRADMVRCRDLLAEVGPSLHPALSSTRSEHVSAKAHRRRVLFLCTGNSARSQMAEAFAAHRSERAIEAFSAGSHPKPLHPNAVRVMAEHGIDISTNQTKPLSRFARSQFDRVITLCDKVREVCPEFPGSPAMAHWSIADPAATVGVANASYASFQQAAADIEGRVNLLIADHHTTTHLEHT